MNPIDRIIYKDTLLLKCRTTVTPRCRICCFGDVSNKFGKLCRISSKQVPSCYDGIIYASKESYKALSRELKNRIL